MRAEAVLDFLFPPRCGGCGARGDWFCGGCRAQARPALRPVCQGCGRACAVDSCPICLYGGSGADSLVAWFVLEGPVREAIHCLKYGDRPRLAAPLVELGLSQGPLPEGVIVPVPLSAGRRRQRGYNQAEAIARQLAGRLGRPQTEGLRRVEDSGAQVGRSGPERRAALRGAFAWPVGRPPGEVLLIDDVVTTGATLSECARALRAAGSHRVHALAVALG
jgi:ComF family protein